MYQKLLQGAEFPKEFVDVLRCCVDCAPLHMSEAVFNERGNILSAKLTCEDCSAEYPIVDGIARFLPQAQSGENQFEMDVRDDEYYKASEYSPCSRSPLSDLVELPPFLRELDINDRSVVFEVGSGDGRFTLLMCQRGARVLAVDLSLNALRKLNGRLASGRAPTPFAQDDVKIRDFRGQVALIHADASAIRLADRSVNRALSTTPLDNAEERSALYRVIANALTDDGWFVGSVEYDDLWRRNLGLPTGRRYAEGIFIEHFSEDKVRREVAPFFASLRTWPIRPRVPFAHRLSLDSGVTLSNILSRLPVLRDMGEILLFRSAQPVRVEPEGVHRQGSFLFKLLFRWYAKFANRAHIWHGEQLKLEAEAE